MTKKELIEGINTMRYGLMKTYRVEKFVGIGVDKIFAKNLDGRYYIHSKAKKKQLEDLYSDIVNFIYDNQLGFDDIFIVADNKVYVR